MEVLLVDQEVQEILMSLCLLWVQLHLLFPLVQKVLQGQADQVVLLLLSYPWVQWVLTLL